ncbi:hypothetical protein N9T78_00560 [Gammaproteobacteria bacterium]|jgi:hypothetical protein|nr:hypothetical protein [Gammaproteobacteria bacterium]
MKSPTIILVTLLKVLKKHPSIIPIGFLVLSFMYYIPQSEYGENLIGLLLTPFCGESGYGCRAFYEYLF